jgi:hypothetical protein
MCGNDTKKSNFQSLSSHFLSENIKIKIYKTIILPTVIYAYEIYCTFGK